MVLVVDNRDSFVFNLARYVRELGEAVVVARSDRLTVADVDVLAPSHIILSPGPCTPDEAGVSTALISQLGPSVPILGVCLGHQCIGAAYGARIVRAGRPTHGRTSPITHDGSGLFSGLPSPLRATRYHSLVISKQHLPSDLVANAWAEDDGEIMGIRHVRHPVVGVQFHPESAASEHGYTLVDRFLHGASAEPLRVSADALLAS